MSPPMAELEDVQKFYGAFQALGPVSVSFPSGILGLLGPNGAGKTTTLRLLLGLIPPTSGEVRVLGEPMDRSAKDLRRRIGYVPEGDARFPNMTGIESVSYAGRLVGMGRADAMQRAHQVLDYVDLGEERYRFVEGYSTGMRQRLKLAEALVHDPELLILDEPTEGVDPEAREEILQLLSDLRRQHGLQLLVSTHILSDVERLADHAIVLSGGRVAAEGPIEELRRARSQAFLVRVSGPASAFTDALDARDVAWAPLDPSVRVNLEDPREILRIAREANLTVRHLAPVQLSLTEALEEAVDASALGGEASA